MLYPTACYLNHVTMTLSAAWEILNPFHQSELAQLRFTNLSCLIVWKISQVHCDFVLHFIVLMSHVLSCSIVLFGLTTTGWIKLLLQLLLLQSSIELLLTPIYICNKPFHFVNKFHLQLVPVIPALYLRRRQHVGYFDVCERMPWRA